MTPDEIEVCPSCKKGCVACYEAGRSHGEIQALPVPASLTESVSNREDTADDQICEHIIGLWRLEHGWDVVLHGDTTYEFTFCPKCGEKL